MPSRKYIQQLANERYEGEIRNAVEAAIEQIADEATLGELERLIRSGDIEGVVSLVTSKVPDAFDRVRDAEIAAMAAAGRETMTVIPPTERNGQRVALKFNPGNARAVQRVNEIHSELIREITEETRGAIRDELRASLDAGENPRTAGRRIRGVWNPNTKRHEGGVLGLTRHQADIARRARERLVSGDPNELRRYLGMKLRDKRYDRTVLNAIENGTEIDADKVEDMAAAYRRKSVQRRAETVARDQSLAALDAGQDSAMDQGIDENVIRDEDVIEEWSTSGDSRVREMHQAVPSMNRGGVRRGEMFETPLGPLRKPRDRQSPGSVPANVIQCRCSRYIRVRRQSA